jgi:hypothetical protein
MVDVREQSQSAGKPPENLDLPIQALNGSRQATAQQYASGTPFVAKDDQSLSRIAALERGEE